MPGPSGVTSLPTLEPEVLQFRHPQAPGAVRPPSRMLARWRSISPVDLAITAAFAIVLIVQISRHEMWRDEIHSWGLVLASPSLPDLFENVRFTGHPGLWYLLLWLASWVTQSPYAVQIVHAAIAISLIGVIGLASPFSRLEKLLLLSSYFVLFEYTVISRNYGLGFLIALIYAHMRATRPDRLYLNACLLGLLANTNMFAFVLSAAFGFEYAVDLLMRRRKEIAAVLSGLLLPTMLYLAFVALAIGAMWPSPDISWRTTGAPLSQALNPMGLLAGAAGVLTTILPIRPLKYWDLGAGGSIHPWDALALPALLFVIFYIFRNHRRLLLIPGLTVAGTVAVHQLVYAGSIRHWGINFVALVAMLWMQRIWSPSRSYLVLALFAINAAAGIAISVQQFPMTFSEGENAAKWIRGHGLVDDALVGTPDTLAAVVAQYLGKPIYFLDCSCTDTYLLYHKRRDSFDRTQVAARLVRAVDELQGRRIVFIISRPLHEPEASALRTAGIDVTPIASFEEASSDENFYLYRVQPSAAGGQLRH